MLFSGFPSKLQEQRLDSVAFLESILVFVLDVRVQKKDFSEETLFWIWFFYKYDKGKHFSTVPSK